MQLFSWLHFPTITKAICAKIKTFSLNTFHAQLYVYTILVFAAIFQLVKYHIIHKSLSRINCSHYISKNEFYMTACVDGNQLPLRQNSCCPLDLFQLYLFFRQFCLSEHTALLNQQILIINSYTSSSSRSQSMLSHHVGVLRTFKTF